MVFTNEKIEHDDIERTARYLTEFLFRSSTRQPDVDRLVPEFDDVLTPYHPDFNEVESFSDDWLSITPGLTSSQKGIVGFDFRVGDVIAKSDVVMDNVTEDDLKQMDNRVLGEGEEYDFFPDKDGDNVYYYKTLESITGSESLELVIDSRSTAARFGCLTHQVGHTREGNVILCIQPFSFPIRVKSQRSSLSQAVVRYKNSPYMTNQEILNSNEIKLEDDVELKLLLNSHGLITRFSTRLAYRALKYNDNMPPIDIDAQAGSLDWRLYYELIEGNLSILTDKKTLHLLGSTGKISLGAVCGLLSREHGVLTGTGAWSHMAGIIHPYWPGEITLEFYSHDKRRISNRSGAGYIRFDQLVGKFTRPESYGGSYQGQKSPCLPRMFKSD